MKINRILCLCSIALVMSACNTPKVDKPVVFETDVEVRIHRLSSSTQEDAPKYYDVNFHYSDAYFDNAATTFSKDLELLSYASCMAGTKDTTKAFYNAMNFVDHEDYNYDITGAHTIGYYFAHKEFKDYDLIAVSIRGLDYKQEWGNNVIIGETGNHAGFDESAETIYGSLKTYINDFDDKTIKLWVSGYSRAGGVANVLSSKLLKEKTDIKIEKENAFFYTFEAPAAVSIENAVAYENVFNVLNELDFIPQIPPKEYGLFRCGKDVLIDNTNTQEKLNALDQTIVLPEFTSLTYTDIKTSEKTEITSPEALESLLFSILLKVPGENDEYLCMETRSDFVNNYQTHLSYLLALFFSLPSETVTHIMTAAKALSTWQMLSLLGDGGIYDFLAPILTQDNIDFKEEDLKPATEVIRTFITGHLDLLLMFVDMSTMSINQAAIDDVMRIAYLHFPEVVYALIK